MIEENLVKSGENKISLSIRRSKGGISLTVKVTPEIEGFFQQMAGESVPVREYGSVWSAPAGKTLAVWHLVPDPGVVYGAYSYRLNAPGKALLTDDERAGDSLINISFLRLVGASEGEGATIEIKGAYSLKYISELAKKLVEASKAFYLEYLRPVDVTVRVTQQETRL